jgi:hypothetical protein
MTIDWSDPHLQGVLVGGAIGLAGVLAAAVAGYLGARGGARIAATAAREVARLAQAESQSDRQVSIDARALERADAQRDRFADRKLSLAVDLLLAADGHADEARVQVAAKYERWEQEDQYGSEAFEGTPADYPTVGSTTPVRAAWQSLDLVAPNVTAEAGELYLATVPLGAMAAAWPDPSYPGDGRTERWPVEWRAALDRWTEARHAFVDAVRIDLDVA